MPAKRIVLLAAFALAACSDGAGVQPFRDPVGVYRQTDRYDTGDVWGWVADTSATLVIRTDGTYLLTADGDTGTGGWGWANEDETSQNVTLGCHLPCRLVGNFGAMNDWTLVPASLFQSAVPTESGINDGANKFVLVNNLSLPSAYAFRRQ